MSTNYRTISFYILGIAIVMSALMVWVSPASLLSLLSDPAEAQSLSVDLTVSPTEVDEGEYVTIEWTSTGAHSCTGTNFSTGGATSGSVDVYQSTEGSYDYTVTCTSSSPACSWVNTQTLTEDYCPPSTCGSLSGACSPQGASCQTVTGSGICTIKIYSCSGSCTTTSDTETVTVNPGPPDAGEPPVIDFSGLPATIDYGESSVLSWSTLGALYCTSDDFGSGLATTSSVTVEPTTTTSYSLMCVGVPLESGGTYSGTWEYIGTDATDWWCPRDYSGYPQCSSENPEGQLCDSPGICGVDSGQCVVYTALYECAGSYVPQWYETSSVFTKVCSNNVNIQQPSCNDAGVTPGSSCTSEEVGNTCKTHAYDLSNACVGQGDVYDTVETYTCQEQELVSENATSTITITVNDAVDLIAGQPSLNSGVLETGEVVTFASLITNNGNVDIVSPFDVRFQLDVDDDGTYDTNFDSANEIAGLVGGGSQNGISQSWTAEEGTHAIRACADLPGNDVDESNEDNNCGADYVFSVVEGTPECSDGIDNDSDGDIDTEDPGCSSSSDDEEADNPECSDGIDNDGDGDTDYPDDLSCSSVFEDNEDLIPPVNLTLAANPSLIRSGNTSSLTWSQSGADPDTCSLSGSNGDFWNLSGSGGSVTTSILISATVFTLTCEDLEGEPESTSTTVRIVPRFDEI